MGKKSASDKEFDRMMLEITRLPSEQAAERLIKEGNKLIKEVNAELARRRRHRRLLIAGAILGVIAGTLIAKFLL